jgi:hypothetical protein
MNVSWNHRCHNHPQLLECRSPVDLVHCPEEPCRSIHFTSQLDNKICWLVAMVPKMVLGQTINNCALSIFAGTDTTRVEEVRVRILGNFVGPKQVPNKIPGHKKIQDDLQHGSRFSGMQQYEMCFTGNTPKHIIPDMFRGMHFLKHFSIISTNIFLTTHFFITSFLFYKIRAQI